MAGLLKGKIIAIKVRIGGEQGLSAGLPAPDKCHNDVTLGEPSYVMLCHNIKLEEHFSTGKTRRKSWR